MTEYCLIVLMILSPPEIRCDGEVGEAFKRPKMVP